MGAYGGALRRYLRSERRSRWLFCLFHASFCAGALALLANILSASTREGEPSLTWVWTAAALGGIWGVLRSLLRTRDSQVQEKTLGTDLEWAETAFSALLLAAFLMYFVLQAFKIPSGSMRSTLLEGDHLFVNKFLYGLRIPFSHRRVWPWQKVERGDIIVFRFPTEDQEEMHCGSRQHGKDFIKRVIGVPGEQVQIRSGQILIDGQPLGAETYAQYVDPYRAPPVRHSLTPGQYQELWKKRILDKTLGEVMRDSFGPVTVPPQSYFVMGDNRDRSCDSRFWGAVSEEYLKGKAWFIYWPPSRMGSLD
ncbi:MAG: signal peptidase I [Elusimicrobia bacterium]|nr:signal peptidase I [Elusimicrobiota bacterium]